MTFSYTDTAIVSTSPTGRHLSTVIKRPAVLMSGWAEHAEAVCKVLNDLHPLNTLVSGLVTAAVAKMKDPVNQALVETIKQKDAQLAAVTTELEESIPRTAAEKQSGYDRVKWAEGLIRQLPETHEGRNSWLLNYGAKQPCR